MRHNKILLTFDQYFGVIQTNVVTGCAYAICIFENYPSIKHQKY